MDPFSQFSQRVQDNFRSQSHFSQRTEELAARLGVLLRDLPAQLGFSPRMLYGYRSGKYPITAKAWRKLEAAERAAGITAEPPTAGGHSATPAPTPGRDPASPPPPPDQALHSLARLTARLDAIEALLHDLLARLDDRP